MERHKGFEEGHIRPVGSRVVVASGWAGPLDLLILSPLKGCWYLWTPKNKVLKPNDMVYNP